MTRLLLFCATNCVLSQMAEGFVRARDRREVSVASAGVTVQPMPAAAVRVMAEVGVDIVGQTAKALDVLESLDFDIVITTCEAASASCPVLPGNPLRIDWNLPELTLAGDDESALAALRSARNEIQRLVGNLFDHGYLAALTLARQSRDVVLNTISDGIIAHDMRRRIFFFNRAAEEITGYSAAEAMNRDCHEVFPGNFCGGKCGFCDGQEPEEFETQKLQLQIRTRSGEDRAVDCVLRSMRDHDGARIGVVVSFHDVTRQRELERRMREMHQFSGIIGRDKRMLEVFDLIREVADASVPVLIEGESGTGKELVAAAIHNEGPRGNRPFITVNCGALPEGLLESELFGHVRGSFTGAVRDKKGRFELADGGTIFLDEIGDITPAMQVKLLRVLQEGTFERVGGERTIRVDVRIISATNRNLAREIEAGKFREDLYYRLNVVPLTLPPLRERSSDIPLLVDYILARIATDTNRERVTVAPEAMSIMMSYPWPGNVRELQNWLQFGLVKSHGKSVGPEHLPPASHTVPHVPPVPAALDFSALTGRKHKRLDAAMVAEALAKTGNNRLEAARLLGVSRATLYRFLDGVNGKA